MFDFGHRRVVSLDILLPVDSFDDVMPIDYLFFFFSSRRRHTRYIGDWSSDVCSSDLRPLLVSAGRPKKGTAIPSRSCTRWSMSSPMRPPARMVSSIRRAAPRLGTTPRSEERRVGKECRARGWRDREKKNESRQEEEKA